VQAPDLGGHPGKQDPVHAAMRRMAACDSRPSPPFTDIRAPGRPAPGWCVCGGGHPVVRAPVGAWVLARICAANKERASWQCLPGSLVSALTVAGSGGGKASSTAESLLGPAIVLDEGAVVEMQAKAKLVCGPQQQRCSQALFFTIEVLSRHSPTLVVSCSCRWISK